MNDRRMIAVLLLCLATAGCGPGGNEDTRQVACTGYAAYFIGAALLRQLPEPFEAELARTMKLSPEVLGARIQRDLVAGAARHEAALEPSRVQRARQEGTELAQQHIGGLDTRASARYLRACLDTAARRNRS